jgi:putative membrane protein
MAANKQLPLQGRKFEGNRLLQILAGVYALFWTLTAIRPWSRAGWLLENLLVFVFVGVLVLTYRRFRLSDLSYLLITIFLIIHGIGAYYTYTQVPLGDWLKEALNLKRNHYDRFGHFSFGLFLAYPVREVFLRVANTRGFWAYYLPMDVVLAFSGLFEIIEVAIAALAGGEAGVNYLGAQGDEWDAQKDMTCAFCGAVLAMLLTAWLRRVRARASIAPR